MARAIRATILTTLLLAAGGLIGCGGGSGGGTVVISTSSHKHDAVCESYSYSYGINCGDVFYYEDLGLTPTEIGIVYHLAYYSPWASHYDIYEYHFFYGYSWYDCAEIAGVDFTVFIVNDHDHYGLGFPHDPVYDYYWFEYCDCHGWDYYVYDFEVEALYEAMFISYSFDYIYGDSVELYLDVYYSFEFALEAAYYDYYYYY